MRPNIQKMTNKISPVKKPEILQGRNFKINETFILTDKTKANTFKITSEKSWERVKDNMMIGYV